MDLPTQNVSTDFVDPKSHPTFEQAKNCWLATATFRLHYLGYLPPSHEWSFHSMTFHQLTSKLEASKFPLGLPVVPTRCHPQWTDVIPKKPKKIATSFFCSIAENLSQNHHEPHEFWTEPHQGHRTQDAEDSHIEAALLDLFVKQENTPGKHPRLVQFTWKYPNQKRKRRNESTLLPPIFGVLGLSFQGRMKTAFPSPFRAEK